MKLWAGFILRLASRNLRMNDCLQVHRKLNLVKRYLFGASVLCMLHSTIVKRMISNLKLAESILQFGKDLANGLRFACDLKVINVSRQ